MSKKRLILDNIEIVDSRLYPTQALTPPIPCTSYSSRGIDDTAEFIPIKEQLVCFDWDGTLSRENSHNAAVQSFVPIKNENRGVEVYNLKTYIPSPEAANFAINYYIDRERAFNNANSIHYNIIDLIERGVNVAIVTYNNFVEIIHYGLEKIGLNKEQISKILIIYGFPVGEFKEVGKMEHIDKAKELCKIENNKHVTLVEDSQINVLLAQKQGIDCCYVTEHNTHTFMQEIMNMVQRKEYGFVSEQILCSSPSEMFKPQAMIPSHKLIASENLSVKNIPNYEVLKPQHHDNNVSESAKNNAENDFDHGEFNETTNSLHVQNFDYENDFDEPIFNFEL